MNIRNLRNSLEIREVRRKAPNVSASSNLEIEKKALESSGKFPVLGYLPRVHLD